jgi:UDP-N-acetyl-D-galactosamine dehydrogenase
MLKRCIQIEGANVLVMGLTFKENCPDIRNTKVVDIIDELKSYNVNVDVHDPWISAESAQHEYQIALTPMPEPGKYDAIILAVAHREFKEIGVDGLRRLGKKEHVLFDLKYVLPKSDSDIRL